MLFTIVYAIISSNYTDRLQMVIAYIQTSTGVGLTAGPAVGSLFFYFGGFPAPFLAFSIFFASTVPVVFVLIGPDRDYIERNSAFQAISLIKSRVRVSQPILLDLISCALIFFGVGVITPIITLHLMSYDLSPEVAGMLYVTNTLAYFIASPLVAKLPSSIPKRHIISVGLVAFALAFYCIASLSPFPDQLGWAVFGLVLFGAAFGVVYGKC